MNDDYNEEHYSDALLYLMNGLSDDMKWYQDEEYPPIVGMSKWLQLEAEAATANVFPHVGVDWARMEPETCSHSWKTYNGFTESFEFCQKCDVKK